MLYYYSVSVLHKAGEVKYTCFIQYRTVYRWKGVTVVFSLLVDVRVIIQSPRWVCYDRVLITLFVTVTPVGVCHILSLVTLVVTVC